MSYTFRGGALLVAFCGVQALHAQFDFRVAGREVQVHSFASQGFAYSNDNNYLTMKTNDGSFAFTDGGVNVSTQITDKFRVGAQAYSRILGRLSRGQVSLDWAVADYKIKPWLGFRGGKVKSTLGLYNDTQDLDFLHTFAMMPQSMYPLDLRSATMAHIGGDIYGGIDVKKLGTFSYTVYGGKRPDDPHDGYRYFLGNLGTSFKSFTGPLVGEDLRWDTPVKGLLVGASHLDSFPHGTAKITGSLASMGSSAYFDFKRYQISQFYAQYTRGNWRMEGEYRREYRDWTIKQNASTPTPIIYDGRAWYAATTYRFGKRVEAGGYYSWYVPNYKLDSAPPTNHIFDKVVTVRLDLTRFWNLKVEEHFMDGFGIQSAARGFYAPPESAMNFAASVRPKTNMLVIRTGWNF